MEPTKGKGVTRINSVVFNSKNITSNTNVQLELESPKSMSDVHYRPLNPYEYATCSQVKRSDLEEQQMLSDDVVKHFPALKRFQDIKSGIDHIGLPIANKLTQYNQSMEQHSNFLSISGISTDAVDRNRLRRYLDKVQVPHRIIKCKDDKVILEVSQDCSELAYSELSGKQLSKHGAPVEVRYVQEGAEFEVHQDSDSTDDTANVGNVNLLMNPEEDQQKWAVLVKVSDVNLPNRHFKSVLKQNGIKYEKIQVNHYKDSTTAVVSFNLYEEAEHAQNMLHGIMMGNSAEVIKTEVVRFPLQKTKEKRVGNRKKSHQRQESNVNTNLLPDGASDCDPARMITMKSEEGCTDVEFGNNQRNQKNGQDIRRNNPQDVEPMLRVVPNERDTVVLPDDRRGEDDGDDKNDKSTVIKTDINMNNDDDKTTCLGNDKRETVLTPSSTGHMSRAIVIQNIGKEFTECQIRDFFSGQDLHEQSFKFCKSSGNGNDVIVTFQCTEYAYEALHVLREQMKAYGDNLVVALMKNDHEDDLKEREKRRRRLRKTKSQFSDKVNVSNRDSSEIKLTRPSRASNTKLGKKTESSTNENGKDQSKNTVLIENLPRVVKERDISQVVWNCPKSKDGFINCRVIDRRAILKFTNDVSALEAVAELHYVRVYGHALKAHMAVPHPDLEATMRRRKREALIERITNTRNTVEKMMEERLNDVLVQIANADDDSLRQTLQQKLEEDQGFYDEYRQTFQHINERIQKLIATEEPITSNIQESDVCAEKVYRQLEREAKRLETPLPIYSRKTHILEVVTNDETKACVIRAETGSGKSTQVPQYLMESISQQINPGSDLAQVKGIVCTQPRRVAAITLAQRIAEEFGCSVGQEVGFIAGNRKQVSNHTLVTFMTDKALLSKCLSDPKYLDRYRYVIVDEAHERSVDTDILIAMLKNEQQKRELKVIIMSATIDVGLFSKYFDNCPVVTIPGRTFPVEVEWCGVGVEGAWGSNGNYVSRAVKKSYDIHVNDIAGDILVFLTSQNEIDCACIDLKRRLGITSEDDDRVSILPLHGKLQPQDQFKVFKKTPHGRRKIVFATNIAETSVTIPGVKYVIDSGMVKEFQYDTKKSMSLLKVTSVTQASAEQRKGRAGRTGPGKCFRLYSQEEYVQMEETMKPEILRVHLGMAAIQLLQMGVRDIEKFQFVEPPAPGAIQQAIKSLFLLGAVDENGMALTELGNKMAKLPLEPRLAKMILEGAKCGMLEDTIAMAALISAPGNVFYQGGSDAERKLDDQQKLQFCVEDGDIITYLGIFKKWQEINGDKAKNKWCMKNSLNAKTLRLVQENVEELKLTIGHSKVVENICKPNVSDNNVKVGIGRKTFSKKSQDNVQNIENTPTNHEPSSKSACDPNGKEVENEHDGGVRYLVENEMADETIREISSDVVKVSPEKSSTDDEAVKCEIECKSTNIHSDKNVAPDTEHVHIHGRSMNDKDNLMEFTDAATSEAIKNHLCGDPIIESMVPEAAQNFQYDGPIIHRDTSKATKNCCDEIISQSNASESDQNFDEPTVQSNASDEDVSVRNNYDEVIVHANACEAVQNSFEPIAHTNASETVQNLDEPISHAGISKANQLFDDIIIHSNASEATQTFEMFDDITLHVTTSEADRHLVPAHTSETDHSIVQGITSEANLITTSLTDIHPGNAKAEPIVSDECTQPDVVVSEKPVPEEDQCTQSDMKIEEKATISEAGVSEDVENKLEINSEPCNPNESLRKILMSAYFENLSIFNGHPRAGYTSASQLKTAVFHPSSALAVLNSKPSWVIYGELRRTSRDFLCVVTPVDIDWIYDVAPLEFHSHIDLKKLESCVMTEMRVASIGTAVMRELSKMRFEGVRKMEHDITNKTGVPCIIDARADTGSLNVFIAAHSKPDAQTNIKKSLMDVKTELQRERFEIPVGTYGSVRHVVKSGGETEFVLFNEENYISVELSGGFGGIQVELVLQKLEEHGIGVEDIANVFKYPKHWAAVRQGKWGKLTFISPTKAKQALDCVSMHNVFGGIEVEPVLPDMRKRALARGIQIPGFINTKITVTWYTGQSKGHAFVDCSQIEDATEIIKTVDSTLLKGRLVRCSRGRKNAKSVYISKIDFSVTPEDLEQHIRQRTTAEFYKAFVPRTKPTHPIPDTTYESDLQELFCRVEDINVEVNVLSEKGMKRKAFVKIDPKSLQTKHRELQRIMISQHKGPGGEIYLLKMSVTCDLYCTKPVFRAVEDELQGAVEEYEECQVNIEDTKKTPPDKRIRMMGETYSAVVKLRRKLQMIVQPEIVYFEDFVTEDVSTVRIDKILRRLAEETLPELLRDTNAHAIVHIRRQVVMLYGNNTDREALKSVLKDYCSTALKTMFREVDVSPRSRSQEGKPLKMLIRRFGPGLEGLKKTCRVKSISIDLKNNMLYIDGTDEGYNRLIEEINESLNVRSKSNVSSTEVDGDECGACFSTPTDERSRPYRLAACGHFFCSACLGEYLKTFVTTKRFPILCPSCNESVMLCDIKNICPQEDQRRALFKAGLDAHIVSNQSGDIKFCPGPDCCMVYVKDDAGGAQVCEECGYCFCNCCGKEAHPDGMNCKEFHISQQESDDLEEYLQRSGANAKTCPVCKIIIEKMDGCNHMQCGYCRSHICWNCLEVFVSAAACYRHMGSDQCNPVGVRNNTRRRRPQVTDEDLENDQVVCNEEERQRQLRLQRAERQRHEYQAQRQRGIEEQQRQEREERRRRRERRLRQHQEEEMRIIMIEQQRREFERIRIENIRKRQREEEQIRLNRDRKEEARERERLRLEWERKEEARERERRERLQQRREAQKRFEDRQREAYRNQKKDDSKCVIL